MRRVTHIYKVLLCAVTVALSADIRADEAFIEGFPDVPLLEGFTLLEAAPIVFDTPTGTIARVEMSGPEPDQALAAYSEVLAELGWHCKRAARLHCGRGEDQLELALHSANAGKNIYELRLSPLVK